MTSLPYDYSRCADESGPCPYRATCLRQTPGRPTYQAYTIYPGGKDCHGLIERDAKP